MQKKDLLPFFNKNTHAVISTCGISGKPEAALIGFGETETFELIFGTDKTSRKYKNIQENNRVAFVIGWEVDPFTTVQYEGIATEIFGEELEKYVSMYHTKVPGATKYKNLPNQAYFKVAPTWIRYSDLNNEQNEVIEEFTF